MAQHLPAMATDYIVDVSKAAKWVSLDIDGTEKATIRIADFDIQKELLGGQIYIELAAEMQFAPRQS